MSQEQCVLLLESEDLKTIDLIAKLKGDGRTRSSVVRQAISEFISRQMEGGVA